MPRDIHALVYRFLVYTLHPWQVGAIHQILDGLTQEPRRNGCGDQVHCPMAEPTRWRPYHEQLNRQLYQRHHSLDQSLKNLQTY